MGPALRPRPLLEQDELPALEVVPGARQDREHLEREEHIAVQVLVQRVPVPLAVAEDQRGRPLLPGRVAAAQQLVVLERKGRPVAAQQFGPVVRDRRQMPVERRAQRRDRVG